MLHKALNAPPLPPIIKSMSQSDIIKLVKSNKKIRDIEWKQFQLDTSGSTKKLNKEYDKLSVSSNQSDIDRSENIKAELENRRVRK